MSVNNPAPISGGSSSFTQAGTGAVTRTVVSKLQESVSVTDFGAVGNGATDDITAFQAAVTAMTALGGGQVIVPNLGNSVYVLSNYINMSSNVWFVGIGSPTLKPIGPGRVFRFNSVSNGGVENFIIDGNKTGVTAGSGSVIYIAGCSNITVRGNRISNQKSALLLSNGTNNCIIDGNTFTGADDTTIQIIDPTTIKNTILNNSITDGLGFGIWVTSGSNHNHIEGNICTSNGIELIGLTYSAWGNRVIGNHAEGCGDNGISISGYSNVVIGNIATKNSFHGICIYGKQNTVTANSCISNGQNILLNYAGIAIAGAFGGTAQNNVVTGNFIDDDQAVPTQYNCIKISGSGYPIWAATTAYTAGSYARTASYNLYKCATSGTSGSTAPSHLSGDATDGTVTWTFVDTFIESTSEPVGNIIGPNAAYRSSSGTAISDGTFNSQNAIFSGSTLRLYGSGDIVVPAGSIYRRAAGWTSSEAVTWGTVRNNNSNVYRCANAGGTTANAPVHGAGTVTGADGIAWLWLRGNSQELPALTLTSGGDFRVTGSLKVQTTDSAATFIPVYAGAGSPESVATAPVGSLYLRTDGGLGSSLYSKTSGSGATGWVSRLDTFTDAAFTLTDDADPTKIAKFQLSAITTGTTRTYTLPDNDGTFINSATNSANFGGLTLGFGTSTATTTYGLASGATLSSSTKTVNIGTGGVSGSTTTINIGSATSSGNVVINQPVSTLTVMDAGFAIIDDVDATKKVVFSSANIPTATTRTLTLPNTNGILAALGTTQDFSGTNTFSATNNSFGTSTATGTTNIAAGATLSGSTKTVNIGTAGVSGSTTSINIGSSTSSGTITVNQSIAGTSATFTGTGLIDGEVGFRNIPQNSQSTAYTAIAADAGKHLLHPAADTTARTFTIPANSSVAYPVGAALTFINENAAGVMTIAITIDTMRLAGPGTTGSRTLAANGIATAIKITSTSWIISGTGLT